MASKLTITIQIENDQLVDLLMMGSSTRSVDALATTIEEVRTLLSVPDEVGHRAWIVATRQETEHILVVLNRPDR